MRWGLFKEELEVIAEIQYQKDSYQQFGITTDRSALRQTVFGAKLYFMILLKTDQKTKFI